MLTNVYRCITGLLRPEARTAEDLLPNGTAAWVTRLKATGYQPSHKFPGRKRTTPKGKGPGHRVRASRSLVALTIPAREGGQ